VNGTEVRDGLEKVISLAGFRSAQNAAISEPTSNEQHAAGEQGSSTGLQPRHVVVIRMGLVVIAVVIGRKGG
jgi:hypothetical protein